MEQDESGAAAAAALAGSRLTRLAEIGAVFAAGGAVIALGWPLVDGDPLKLQGVIWVANVVMLATVGLALRLRGEGWEHLGLHLGSFGGRDLWRAVWRSLVVFLAAMAAFVLGAIVMAGIVGRPEPADMSGYGYLSGNLPMLAIALVAVFVASSLGEEILYRGFLITRLAELGAGRRTAWRAALVVSAIVFGLIHYAWGPMGIVQTAFMGLALGVAYLVLGRNLWPLVLAHFYMDALLLAQMYLGVG